MICTIPFRPLSFHWFRIISKWPPYAAVVKAVLKFPHNPKKISVFEFENCLGKMEYDRKN